MLKHIVFILCAVLITSCGSTDFSKHLKSIIIIQEDYLESLVKVKSKEDFTKLINKYKIRIEKLAKEVSKNHEQYIAIKADVESGMVPEKYKGFYANIRKNIETIKTRTDEIIYQYKVEPFAAYALDEFLQTTRRIIFLPILED